MQEQVRAGVADDPSELANDALWSRRLGPNFAVRCLRPRLRYLLSRQPKPLDVKLDGIVHFPLDFRARAAGGDAPWQVRRISRVAGAGRLDND